MMENIESVIYGTYMFRHAFFIENNYSTDGNEIYFACNRSYSVKLPKFLTRVTRSRKIYPPEVRSKYITKPLYTSVVGVHEMFEHVGYHIKTYVIPPDYALLHHCRDVTRGSTSVFQDESHYGSIRDARAVVFKKRIVAELRKRLCRNAV